MKATVLKRLLPVSCFLMAGSLFGQNITSVQNAASNLVSALPNYSIAPGSVFDVFGTGLGPASIVLGSLPFQTTLSSASVKVVAGGTTYAAPIVFVLNTQIAAIMPSAVPAGSATVQVTYNGTAGNSFATSIAASNFGISTINQSGGGAAVVTEPDYTVITATHSAKPGSTYVIWGTGLGASADDSGNTPLISAPAISIYVGGKKADQPSVARSPGSPGLDQIAFKIPDGLSGCNISLVIQTGNTVSNSTSIPIAANGGTCTDSNLPANSAITTALGKGSLSVGTVALSQTSVSFSILGQTSSITTGVAAGNFLRYTPSQYSYANSTATSGSCLVSVSTGVALPASLMPAGLDAGTVKVGSTTLSSSTKGTYASGTGFTFAPGTYTISNGAGGADVGAFSVNLVVPPTQVWTNQTGLSGSTIARASGTTVTWSGGDPAGTTYIFGSSSSGSISVTFSCTAPTSAGQFAIPATVLLALPVSTVSGGTPTGALAVGSYANPVSFTATGLDAGYAVASNFSLVNVSYQ